MVNEVSQWLAEIQTLQQQLKVLGQERDQAYASAANWRRLYESESEQRRNDSERSQARIRALANELELFKQAPVEGEVSRDLEQALVKVNQVESLDELRSQLIDALTLCEQLSNALKTEQAVHEETSQSLTTALGDTIDLLAKDHPPESPESTEATE
jgi:histidyl-tRNA synthetase